jgi:recombination protein RecA
MSEDDTQESVSTMDKALDIISNKDKTDIEKDKVNTNPDELRTHEAVSTGSIMADHIIGGAKTESGERQCPGFPRGKLTEIFGPQGSGKTTLALHACAQAQYEGGVAAFIDFENALALDWASKIGVDVADDDKWHLWTPQTMERGFEYMDAYIQADADIVVVDSVPAMTPEVELEGSISDMDKGGIGLKARMMSQFTKRILNKNDHTALVFINQTRTNINTGYGPSGEKTPGGNALNFYTSLRLRLEAKDVRKDQIEDEVTGEEKTEPVETETEIKVQKTKVSGNRYKKGRFWIRYNQGIDNIRTVIKMAEYKGLIEKNGAWYSYETPSGEEENIQGRDNLRDEIVSNPQIQEWIMNQVIETDEPDDAQEEMNEDES